MFLEEVEKTNKFINSILLEEKSQPIPFYNSSGKPIFWLYKNWLVTSNREKFAFLKYNSVWTLEKEYLGVLINKMILNKNGKILAYSLGGDRDITSRRYKAGPKPVTPKPQFVPRFGIPEDITVKKSKKYFSNLEIN